MLMASLAAIDWPDNLTTVKFGRHNTKYFFLYQYQAVPQSSLVVVFHDDCSITVYHTGLDKGRAGSLTPMLSLKCMTAWEHDRIN
jgi:hypothetical protein